MVFKRIEIEGFLSYYKRTEIAFSEGNTLIIGKNNTGKSKLFDAFHWGLFNRVFDALKQRWIMWPDEVNRMILNNRLKKEASANGDTATVSVAIVLEAEEYENQTVTITRTNKYDFSASATTPQVTSSLAFYAEDSVTGDNPHTYIGADAKNRITQLFPPCIQDFILFQGETAGKLMEPENQDTVKNAIEEISRIKLFQQATEIAKNYLSLTEKKLKKSVKLSQERQTRMNWLENDVAEKEKEMQSLEERKDSSEKTIAELTKSCDGLSSKLSQYERIEAILKEKDKYKQEYDDARDELKKYKEVHKEIASTWIFYKVRDKLASFSDFYNSLELLGHVPPPIMQTEIKASLERHTCTLCGNHLDEDSEYYKNVKAKERDDIIDRFGKAVSNINFAISSRIQEFENVPKAIESYNAGVDAQKRAREAASKKLKEAEGKLKDIQITDADRKAKESFDDMKKLLIKNDSELKKLREEKSKLEGQIKDLNEKVAQRKSEMTSLLHLASEKTDNAELIKSYYAAKLAECMKKLCTSVQDVAYAEIQKEANSYYHEMAKEAPAIIGDIKIDREK